MAYHLLVTVLIGGSVLLLSVLNVMRALYASGICQAPEFPSGPNAWHAHAVVEPVYIPLRGAAPLQLNESDPRLERLAARGSDAQSIF
jgi:hypothetical protein